MKTFAIEIKGLDVRRGGASILALDEWTLDAGAHGLILGPSGSGKTTLLNVISGLLEPNAGAVHVGGEALYDMSAAARDRWRGGACGHVYQTLRLPPVFSVRDNLRLAQYLAGRPADEARIAALLNSLGLAEKANAKPARLSVGEAQRAAIARAVVNQPKLILADEPTSALDDDNCKHVVDLLLREAEACGASLLIATHDGRLKETFPTLLALDKGARA